MPVRINKKVRNRFSWKKTEMGRPFQDTHSTPAMHKKMQKTRFGPSFSLNSRTLARVMKMVWAGWVMIFP